MEDGEDDPPYFEYMQALRQGDDVMELSTVIAKAGGNQEVIDDACKEWSAKRVKRGPPASG